MPMFEDYTDEKLWQEDFDCWLNGEELKQQSRLPKPRKDG